MIHLITGGSGSGKSVYAENWLIRQGSREACGKEKPFLYIATMRPFGQESRQKILRHRNQRAGKGFGHPGVLPGSGSPGDSGNAGILLECVMNLTANESYREDEKDAQEKGEDKVAEKVLEGIRHLSEHTAYLAVVTGQVDGDIDSYSEGETRTYQKILGETNQKIGSAADQITEVVYGIPVPVKV